MEPGQVNSWYRYQGNQPGNKIQWLKYDMGGAIAPGCSPKAPTFGSTRIAPCHYGSLTGAWWKPPVSLCNGTPSTH
jgi:hypothetical protein